MENSETNHAVESAGGVSPFKDLCYDAGRASFAPNQQCIAEFNNLSFYRQIKGREKEYILKDFNAVLNKGSITAIVSPRSVDFAPFVEMLLRTYDYPEYMIESGSIAVKGVNITNKKRDEAQKILEKVFNVAAPVMGAGVLWREHKSDATVKDFISQKVFHEFYDDSELEKSLGSVGFSNVEELYAKNYDSLSLADKERVKLAQDLCYPQDVAVMVYPPMCLDAECKVLLKRLMLDRIVTNTVRCILLLTEDMEFAASCADQIYVLDKGEIIDGGARQSVINGFKNELVRKILANGLPEKD